jgi:hypothetical protein
MFNTYTHGYKGLRIVVSESAMRELFAEEKTLFEVVAILENGYDAPRKRKKGTIERWLNTGSKIYNAVVVKDFNDAMQEECWVLIPFGKFTRK